MKVSMDSKMSQKKIISVFLTRIDIENIRNGVAVEAQVKTNFECEVPYELIVRREDGKE